MQGIPIKLSSPIIQTPNKGLYQIQKQLGQGAYGEVFLVMNIQTKKQYALKKQEDMSRAEQNIMQQLANKQFSNLINVIEYYQSPSDKHFYIVMEYCESDLYQEMQKKVFQEDDIRYIMKQIATGIQQLHSLDIIHRDIKPDNILIYNLRNDQGRTQQIYKICDFGLSKQANITQTAKQGIPYYLSPEQLKPGNQYTNSIDIWAFGAVIYELLMKKPLFNGQTQEQVYQKIKNEDINKLLSTILKSQLEYQALLMRMLDRDPRRRPKIDEVILKLSPSIISRGLSPPIRTPTLQPPSYQPNTSKYLNQRTQPDQQPIRMNHTPVKLQQQYQLNQISPQLKQNIINQNNKSDNQPTSINFEQNRQQFFYKQQVNPYYQPIQRNDLATVESRGRLIQHNNPIEPNTNTTPIEFNQLVSNQATPVQAKQLKNINPFQATKSIDVIKLQPDMNLRPLPQTCTPKNQLPQPQRLKPRNNTAYRL